MSCRRNTKVVLYLYFILLLFLSLRLFAVDDFDSQLHQLLEREMLTPKEIEYLSTVYHDLQETLQMLWPGAEVIPVGSMMTGLSIKSSDADCMVKVPPYNDYNETVAKQVILQAVHQLKQQPELYDNARPKFRHHGKIPLLLFDYIPTQRNCDVSFISTEGLETSRLLADFYSLDDRARTLALILKLWNKTDPTQPYGILDNYTLNLLIIFYLQQQNILPPYYLLQSALKNATLNRLHNLLPSYELMGGFFEYYNEFNYAEYVISPLLGRTVHKSEFEDFESLPEQQSEYKTHMKQPDSKPIAMRTPICVQDVFLQHFNVAEHTKPSRISAFMSNIKLGAEKYHRVSSDRFLGALLTNYTHVSKYRKRLS